MRSALLSAADYLQANCDDEMAIPALVQVYLALCELDSISLESLLESRGQERMPSVNALGGDSCKSEWDWVTKVVQKLNVGLKLYIRVQEISGAEFQIRIVNEVDQIYSILEADGIFSDTADLIAEVAALCLKYHGFKP